MPRKKYPFHPACLIFPQLPPDELHELADDIRNHGLRNPIVLLGGKILDGRNRYLACGIAGVDPVFTDFTGDDPIRFVISQNLQRRHLTASQKAVVALDLLPLLEQAARERQRLAKKCAKVNKGKAAEFAAKIVGGNARYVEAVKSIQKTAPKLINKIRSGELNVLDAVEIVKSSNNGNGKGSYVFQAGTLENIRPADIATPLGVCRFLHDVIKPAYRVTTILDPCAGSGNLTKPWKGCKVIAFESSRGKDFFKCADRIECDLVLCNPPFNGGTKTAKSPVSLFLGRILDVVPKRTPIALIAHWSFRMDQDCSSSRWKWLRDSCPPITSIISLPHDVWNDAKVHSEILLFNAPKLKPHYFLPDEYL
jgi:hypothetical protein